MLTRAARLSNVDARGAVTVRDGSHAIFELPNGIVARIGKPHSYRTAQRELRISQWLNRNGIATVKAVNSIPQPTLVDERPVTWWTLIPDHRPSTPEELGTMLRRLHALTPPTEFPLPSYAPFDGVREPIESATTIAEDDRSWLLEQYARLHDLYDELDEPSQPRVIHGDAWQGNLVVPPSGEPIVLDLDKVSVGWREWDLIQLAVDYTDFQRITNDQYRTFVDAYGGYDVTRWPGYRVIADIQEFRWAAFALGRSDTRQAAAAEAEHRIACLRGLVPKPWTWRAL
ncbi:aminoglycoside phosphotransferase family protein [Nocardia seriolae]|nr:phosphotransferase [Nocardia seriolae]MTJ76387.1 phosphotransferase [Nocardia seriolae]MTJ88225.1 phosphotransferase [Nocardia seriolae]MTK32213.1 phosphotransferase [Nocardia seriolae]MTK41556.1 phosphotransferase [Nocardia seriolae]